MRKVAAIGTYQTPYKKEDEKNFAHMIFEASHGALKDAGISIKEVDAVIFGSSPEAVYGVNHPEMLCVGGAGGVFKPYLRIHTGGTVGIATAVTGFYFVASGLYDIVLTVAGDKLTDGPVQHALSMTTYPLFHRRFAAGAAGGAGMGLRETMHKRGFTREQAAYVAVKQRKHALLNPYAHVKMEITVQDVLNSKVISEPLRLLDSCPVSDGAAAVVFVSEEVVRKKKEGGEEVNPAWVLGVGASSEPPNWPGRDPDEGLTFKEACKKAYEMAGIKNPGKEIDVFEFYDAFSFQEISFLEDSGICERGEGGKLTESGDTTLGGKGPIVNPSGGVLSANTIGCAAMARVIEAILQVQGKAERRQVPNVRKALAHGWGGHYQFHYVMIFGKEPPKW